MRTLGARREDAIAQRNCRKRVAIPHSPGKPLPAEWHTFIRQGPNGEADFPVMGGDEPGDKVSQIFRDAGYARLEDREGGSEFVTEMLAPLESFTLDVAFAEMPPCVVWRFRNGRMCLAIGAKAVVEFDLPLKRVVRLSKIVPASSDGQSSAGYPGRVQDGLQFFTHPVGVLSNRLPIPIRFRILLIPIVTDQRCGRNWLNVEWNRRIESSLPRVAPRFRWQEVVLTGNNAEFARLLFYSCPLTFQVVPTPRSQSFTTPIGAGQSSRLCA